MLETNTNTNINANKEKDYKKNLYGAVGMLALVLCVFFALKFFTELRSYRMISSSTITVSGHGEVEAVPDIANVSFSITKEAKTAKEAQDAVAKIELAAIESLKSNNVLEKDFKTTNASFYPKYEWQSIGGVRLGCNEWGGCPPNSKSVIIGYEATESMTVKVRDTDRAGKIMQDLGTIGVSNLNGPNFSIDDVDQLNLEARKKAIDNAQEKASVLAKDLGVHLGKISSFNEGGNYPIMYNKAMLESASMGDASAPAQLPKGENTISSDVTITYLIR